MQRVPRPYEIYRHFKGMQYQILSIATHSETSEQMVVYQQLYAPFGVYVRPLAMFMSKVDKEKYPDAEQQYRFEKVIRENLDGACPVEKQESGEKKNRSISDKMMDFFDTEDLEKRYKILCTMREEITDGMIDNMAVVMDLVIPDGPTTDRYDDLKRAVATKQKYEQNKRLR